MKFLTRNKNWIILLWILSVLLFFKFYNGFVFKNNQSIIFIVALLIIPVLLQIISKITYLKNKKKYLNKTTNYYELVNKTISNELISKLKKITYVEEIDDVIYFGVSKRGMIVYNSDYLEITILNTLVSFKYYYTKNLESFSYYDKRGFEYQNPKLLYNEIINDIELLLNYELEYEESKKILDVNYVKLSSNDVTRYIFKKKDNKKYKATYKEKFRL